MKKLSEELANVLECLGYNRNMILKRRILYRIVDFQVNQLSEVTVLTVGSKGEGITKFRESDTDKIVFIPKIFCTENLNSGPEVSAEDTVFNIKHTCPGYCILELAKLGNTTVDSRIIRSMVLYKGSNVLASGKYSEEMRKSVPYTQRLCRIPQKDCKMFNITGPAQTGFTQSGWYDYVFTLNCDGSSIIERFLRRSRNTDWPPMSLRKIIPRMNCNLVAAGKNGSETEQLEWRFCFNKIELLLVETLNDSQIKLYKMLKIINTDILKENGFSVTSFMMKNIVFWLAEQYPQSMFCPETLLSWISKALRVLKHSVKLNYLPYYMIPGRNLLAEKVSEAERQSLFGFLSVLMQMCPSIYLQCEKVLLPMQQCSDLAHLREKYEQFECAELSLYLYHETVRKQGMSKEDMIKDPVIVRYQHDMRQSIKSGWPLYIQETLNDEMSIGDMMIAILS